MNILNINEFKRDNFNAYRERRTSQYTRFLDKTVDFVTYYSINRAFSTESINNHAVDSYIGDDSPVRYNKINNMPVYGMPEITATNSYDETAGFQNEFEGSIIILHDIIEPVEGDAFILDIFSKLRFFTITSVEQIVMRSKPHYVCTFTVGIPEKLAQLNKQVVEEYNAIFDNIGTQDRVIVSSNEYNLRGEYIKLYEEIHNYYIAAYFDNKISTFNITADMPVTGGGINFIDKYAMMFMKDTRTIAYDSVLRTTFTFDYNYPVNAIDALEYKKSIYWAVANREMKNYLPAKYIQCKKIASPFSLIYNERNDEFFRSDKFLTDISAAGDNRFYVPFDYAELYKRWKEKDYQRSGTCYDRVLSLIIGYMMNNILMPGYFADLIGEMTPIQEFVYLPVILYIIRANINGLMTSNLTI